MTTALLFLVLNAGMFSLNVALYAAGGNPLSLGGAALSGVFVVFCLLWIARES